MPGGPRAAGKRDPGPARSGAAAAAPARAPGRPAVGGAEPPWPRGTVAGRAARGWGRSDRTPGLPWAPPSRVGRLRPLPASTPAKGRDAPRGGLPAGGVPPRSLPRRAAQVRAPPAPACGPRVRSPSSLSPLRVSPRSRPRAGEFDFHPFPFAVAPGPTSSLSSGSFDVRPHLESQRKSVFLVPVPLYSTPLFTPFLLFCSGFPFSSGGRGGSSPGAFPVRIRGRKWEQSFPAGVTRTRGDAIPGGQPPGLIPLCLPSAQSTVCPERLTLRLLRDSPRLLTHRTLVSGCDDSSFRTWADCISPLHPESCAVPSSVFLPLPPAPLVAFSLSFPFHPTRSRHTSVSKTVFLSPSSILNPPPSVFHSLSNPSAFA